MVRCVLPNNSLSNMKNIIITLTSAFLFCAGLGAKNEPTVTTNVSFARGATMAFGRASFKAVGGNAITEKGFCWSSEHREPTVDDSSSKETISNNGLIFCMKNLQPATVYYARPYAKTSNGSIGYGEALKIVTLPKGTVSWGYDNGGSADENSRINSAVKACVDYWNDLTNIEGLYLDVHYGAQTPTADCSYGGWMRVGPNASYQKTGTIMHEALHAIGVGQHDIWYGSDSPLRAGNGTGQWLGDRATEFLRFWDNNATEILNGDNTHLWPYGINGAHEDNGTVLLYYGCSLLAQAVGEDGLPCTKTRGCASPYYSLNHEDSIKYYIKNESEEGGLTTAFLIETSDHKLQWKTMSAEKAVETPAAAWYITFSPNNQYYQIRNAKTGYYMTYKSTGMNGIVTAKRTELTANDNFQLMRSRIDITSDEGQKMTNERGYWVIHPSSSLTPPCLAASTNGNTAVVNFNLANSSTKQRWLFLTEQQAAEMANYGMISAQNAYQNEFSKLTAIKDIEYMEVTIGARSTFEKAIDSISAQYATATTPESVLSLVESLKEATASYLSAVCVKDIEHPFEITDQLTNPYFATDKSGWKGAIVNAGTWRNQLVEFYECEASANQTLENMPAGLYELRVKAFQRPGSTSDVYSSYNAGKNGVGAKIYLNSSTTGFVMMKNIMMDRSKSKLYSDDVQVSDGSYVPNSMAGAETYFEAGLYDNTVQYFLPEAGPLKVGMVALDNKASKYWTIFSQFRLYYYGPKTLDEIKEMAADITAIEDHKSTISPLFNLSGVCIRETKASGLYIKNGKIIMIK